MRRLLATAIAALIVPGVASASQLVDRDASHLRLLVSADGKALLRYDVKGRPRKVVVWGAINARRPTPTLAQEKLQVDYTGTTWGKRRNACRPYDGPKLAFFVTGCTAVDGSYWAVQSWQRALPDLGFVPWLPSQSARELHVSHWTGPLAELELHTDWVWGGRWQELFGKLTYDGFPVYGFKTTNKGYTLDGYGRNVFLDTYNSVYGPGWRRENGFVTHNPNGDFCYGFYPFQTSNYPHPDLSAGTRGPGVGEQYRVTVAGPGVTPIVTVTVPGLHSFDARNPADVAYENEQDALRKQLAAGEKLCQHT